MAQQIGNLAASVTEEARSLASSTKDSISSDNQKKRHFLQVFRRWEAVFKRADKGDEEMERMMVAEYYRSLCHLSPEGLEALTDKLKETCTFFPTIKECLDIVNISEHSYDWGNPFRKKRSGLFLSSKAAPAISAPTRPYGMLSDNRPIPDEPDILEDPIHD